MKKRVYAASVIAAVSVITYPFTSAYAAIERGYAGVFGGEDILLIFGLFIAVLLIIDGLQRFFTQKEKDDCQTATAFSPESEQSDEHITLSQASYTTNIQ